MDETIEIEGLRMRYDRIGDGPRPVIVMHGWGCNASTVRILAEAAASPSTTVYNLDLPGFGGSQEPPADWGVYDYAGFIEAFAKAVGAERPVLIGHSYGGRIAIVYASECAVDKVILVDAAGIKPRRSLRYYIKVYSFKLAKRVLPIVLGRRKASEVIDRMRGNAGSADYNAASPVMRRVMSKSVNQDLKHLMPLIKAPTLLIWGAKDTATPLRDAKTMERLIPDAGLVCYEDADHYSFLRRPAQTDAVIKSFLKI